jgi:outer membrane protein TolC
MPLLPIVLVLLLAAPAVAQPHPLPLAEALDEVMSGHESLQAAAAEIEAREREVRAARGLRWPRVELAARHTWIDTPIIIDLDPVRQAMLGLHPGVPPAALPPFILEVQSDQFWRAHLEAVWPVFTGGRVTAAGRAASAELDDARQQRRQTVQGLTTELVRRYFGQRLAEQVLAVRAEVLAGLDRHLYEARRLEEEGLIARAERLRAEVAHAEAQRQVLAAERTLAVARTALKALLDPARGGSEIETVSSLFVLPALAPLDTFRAAALRHHPALARLDSRRELARQAVAAEQGRWLPEVFLFGRRELLEDDLTLLEPAWAAGVGARWTLLAGGDRWHRGHAAQARERRVEHLQGRARRDLSTLVDQRYQEVLQARDQFDALAVALGLAEENQRVWSASFAEGMATSLDVIDARLALSRVRLERLAAAYQFDVALAGLLEACGMSERFLELMAQEALEVD